MGWPAHRESVKVIIPRQLGLDHHMRKGGRTESFSNHRQQRFRTLNRRKVCVNRDQKAG